MIMPANYSVIAENELSYVDGGWVDVMSAKTLETNIAKAIGNQYAQKVMAAFIGTWFADEGAGNSVFKTFGKNVGDLFTGNGKYFSANTGVGKALAVVRNTIGVLGGIWVLGSYDMVETKKIGLFNPTSSPKYSLAITDPDGKDVLGGYQVEVW